MARNLSGKVALVTGGGSGIGRETGLTFAREGAKVVIADVAVDGGEESKRMIQDMGGEAIFVRADVSKADEVEALVKKAVEAYGRLDCAHNNAATRKGPRVPTHEYPEDEWDRIINVDLKGIWLCMKYEIRQMLKQGSGAIVNTSSINGLVAGENDCPYVAGKHGVVGITKTAAIEYARSGIRVNAVCPSAIDTPRTRNLKTFDPEAEAHNLDECPLGREGMPREVAEPVVWLCSDAASFVTGHVMAVDGGFLAQ